MELDKNYHGEPARILKWVDGRVARKIDISVKNCSIRTYSIGIVAWEDRNDGRYWKHALIRADLTSPFNQAEIVRILGQADNLVKKWASGDLSPAYPAETWRARISRVKQKLSAFWRKESIAVLFSVRYIYFECPYTRIDCFFFGSDTGSTRERGRCYY